MINQPKDLLKRELDRTRGILRLAPAFVARDFLPPGRRLGLDPAQYDLGKRGGICERWLASTTEADNPVKVPDEGLSFIPLGPSKRVTLREAVQILPEEILGGEYAQTHPRGLDRLAKIFDYQYRIPFHLHQMEEHAALVGRNPKEEAYYFPEGVPMGAEPETYLGLHPSIVEQGRHDVLLPHMVEWKDDHILQHSRAYKLIPGDGWHIPAGILHAPGSALTIELQEDSDVFAMMQALAGGKLISKELLFKDVRHEDRTKHGERIILDMIDWETNGDHYFYEHHHTPPLRCTDEEQQGGEQQWIFYNTLKFSGKKLSVRPGRTYLSRDRGVYSLFVWSGEGTVGGVGVKAGSPNLDELLIVHRTATEDLQIVNTGSSALVLFKFYGPDVNPDAPMLPAQ
jgi:hypothetical protein